MLWYKSWLDTRRWFLLGLMAPLGQVLALYMSYPMDAATTYPNGALGVSPAEMVLVRAGDFRSSSLSIFRAYSQARSVSPFRQLSPPGPPSM